MKDHANTILTILSLILIFTLWGSLYVVSVFVLGKLPTFTISFFRFVLAFLFLSVLTRNNKKKIAKQDVPYVVLLGAAGYFLAVGAQLMGTKISGSGMASLINSLNPVSMSLFGALIFHEQLTRKKVAGLFLALIGVYCIIGSNAKNAGVAGILLSLFAVILWSFISVITRKISRKYNPLYITKLGVGIAALCYLPVSAGELIACRGEALHTLISDPTCVLSLCYMGFFCTGLAYLLWNRCLLEMEASTCSSFYPIQPMVSTMLGIIIFHETITGGFIIGSLLIIAGVLLTLSKKTGAHTLIPHIDHYGNSKL